MSCLILFKSITYAQSGAQRLKERGIVSYISRIPSELAAGGCGYALKIKCGDAQNAREILKNRGVAFTSCFEKQRDGVYREL